MARETVGYVELEWICPQCGVRNKGSQRKCIGCGAAQPADVTFIQPAQQSFVEDEAKIEAARAGADIHCAYCGARNPATATVCVNCGSDLREGAARPTGQVVGTFQVETGKQINCPACGTANHAANLRCSNCGASLAVTPVQVPNMARPQGTAAAPAPAWMKWIWIPILVVVGFTCVFLMSLFFRREDASAVVARRMWERNVAIEQYGPVQRSGWGDQVPASANVLSCNQRHRYTSNSPVAGADQVCGTPYTIDSGSGFGEVVQDCVYEVYDDYCSYEVNDWSTVDTLSVSGENDAPYWPSAQLTSQQRAGGQSEQYRIIFDIDGDFKSFDTDDIQVYNLAQPGSQWVLTVNGFGEIVDLELSQ